MIQSFTSILIRHNNNSSISSQNKPTYKQIHSYEFRLRESTNITEKYPDRIPIICERVYNAINAPEIDKKKYLVPCDLTVGHFIYIIRKRMQLRPEQGLYVFINGIIPPTAELLVNLYREYKDIDGFLYISYNAENTFG